MKEVTIKVPEGKSAEWQEVNGVQTLVLVDEKPKNVMERVKTFEDACNELGIKHDDWVQDKKGLGLEADVIAYLKLRIIVAALNEGWEPKFTLGEYRWFPWFRLLTKEEIEELDEDEKCRVVGWASGSADASGGLVYSDANYVSTFSSTYFGSQLALKSEELAEYAGEQFREIYADFCFMSEK